MHADAVVSPLPHTPCHERTPRHIWAVQKTSTRIGSDQLQSPSHQSIRRRLLTPVPTPYSKPIAPRQITASAAPAPSFSSP